jgi:hypothetical protein
LGNYFRKYVNRGASKSIIVGDAGVDVGLGAVSLTGAAIGLGLSIGVSYVLEGFKFGKEKETISEKVKKSVQKGIKAFSSLFG